MLQSALHVCISACDSALLQVRELSSMVDPGPAPGAREPPEQPQAQLAQQQQLAQAAAGEWYWPGEDDGAWGMAADLAGLRRKEDVALPAGGAAGGAERRRGKEAEGQGSRRRGGWRGGEAEGKGSSGRGREAGGGAGKQGREQRVYCIVLYCIVLY